MSPVLGISSVDGFALAMVAILGVSFGVVFLLLLSILRHGGRRNREVEDLLDEVERESRPPAAPRQPAGDPAEGAKREPWEKDADWWKRD